MADLSTNATSGKVVIKNIGLLLSGDLERPILDADTIVVNDGLIVAVGREKDCDTEHARTTIDARGTCVAPGLIDIRVKTGEPGAEPLLRPGQPPADGRLADPQRLRRLRLGQPLEGAED